MEGAVHSGNIVAGQITRTDVDTYMIHFFLTLFADIFLQIFSFRFFVAFKFLVIFFKLY